VLFVLLFVGWGLAGTALNELRQGAGALDTFGPAWIWPIRTVVILGMIATLLLGFQGLFLGEDPTFFAPFRDVPTGARSGRPERYRTRYASPSGRNRPRSASRR